MRQTRKYRWKIEYNCRSFFIGKVCSFTYSISQFFDSKYVVPCLFDVFIHEWKVLEIFHVTNTPDIHLSLPPLLTSWFCQLQWLRKELKRIAESQYFLSFASHSPLTMLIYLEIWAQLPSTGTRFVLPNVLSSKPNIVPGGAIVFIYGVIY